MTVGSVRIQIIQTVNTSSMMSAGHRYKCPQSNVIIFRWPRKKRLITRTIFNNCTANRPATILITRCFHDAGKASMAAMSIMAASTPLQPDPTESAKPLVVLCRTLPKTATRRSENVIRSAMIRGSAWDYGTTRAVCTGAANLAPNNAAYITTK